jgi:hypothetical protein
MPSKAHLTSSKRQPTRAHLHPISNPHLRPNSHPFLSFHLLFLKKIKIKIKNNN